METPWRLNTHCHGDVYLTREQYAAQLNAADRLWCCPHDGNTASWDDNWYEAVQQVMHCFFLRCTMDRQQEHVAYLPDGHEIHSCNECPANDIEVSSVEEWHKVRRVAMSEVERNVHGRVIR